MAMNVRMIPADGAVEFYNSTGTLAAKMYLDGDDLVFDGILGDLVWGDASSDVYIGDGVANVDIIFEQDGEIRALTGKTLTLGQSDSYIDVAAPTTFNNGAVVSGSTFWVASGVGTNYEGIKMSVPDTTDDNPDIELFFVENHTLTYGARFFYDGGANTFSLYMHDNSAPGQQVYSVARSTGKMDFKVQPSYNGSNLITSVDAGNFTAANIDETITGNWTFTGQAVFNGNSGGQAMGYKDANAGGWALYSDDGWSSHLLGNAYFNGTTEVYRISGRGATKYYMSHDGSTSQGHRMYVASEGTAGAAVSWTKVFEATTAMLDLASGAVIKIGGTQVTSNILSDVGSIAMLDEDETVTGAWTIQNNLVIDNSGTGHTYLYLDATGTYAAGVLLRDGGAVKGKYGLATTGNHWITGSVDQDVVLSSVSGRVVVGAVDAIRLIVDDGPAANGSYVFGRSTEAATGARLGAEVSDESMFLYLWSNQTGGAGQAIVWTEGDNLRLGTESAPGTGWSEKARFNSSGHFGIGLTPSYQFHVQNVGSSGWTGVFDGNGGTEDASVYIAHADGYGIAVDSTENDSKYLLKLMAGTGGGTGKGTVPVFYARADQKTGINTSSPLTSLHVAYSAMANLSNLHLNTHTGFLQTGVESVAQIAADDAGAKGALFLLTNTPTSGNNKHWWFHHGAPDYSNRLDIGYNTTASSGADVFSNDPIMRLSTGGNSYFANDMVIGSLAHNGTEGTARILTLRNPDAQHNYLVYESSAFQSWNQLIHYATDGTWRNTWRIGTYDYDWNHATPNARLWRLAMVYNGGTLNYIVAGIHGGSGSTNATYDGVSLYYPRFVGTSLGSYGEAGAVLGNIDDNGVYLHADANKVFEFGKAKMGYLDASWGDNFAIAHYDEFNLTDYSIGILSGGNLRLNAPTSKSISMRINGAEIGALDASGFTLASGFVTAPDIRFTGKLYTHESVDTNYLEYNDWQANTGGLMRIANIGSGGMSIDPGSGGLAITQDVTLATGKKLATEAVEVHSSNSTEKFTIDYNETDDTLDFIFASS